MKKLSQKFNVGILFTLLLSGVLTVAAIAEPASSDSSSLKSLEIIQLKVQGLFRTVRIYRPRHLPQHPALVLALHGTGGDGERLRRLTGGAFEDVADKYGFILAYPDALGKQWNDCRTSAPYHHTLQAVDDIAFLRAVVHHVKGVLGQDLSAVFAVGYSNGGHLVFRIAYEAPTDFTAVAAFGAHLPVPEQCDCVGSATAVPIVLVSGTDDPVNPWAGGEVRTPLGTSPGRVISANATAAHFRQVADVSSPPVVVRYADSDTSDGAWVETHVWGDEGHPQVELITVHGGGHTLPHPTAPFPVEIVGRTCRDVNGAEMIWKFFAQQLPGE
jgi:polyhydroxybutyrate depolymerase